MAALVVLTGSVLEHFYRFGCVLFRSGFSWRKFCKYFNETQKELVFERYLAEVKNSLETGKYSNSSNLILENQTKSRMEQQGDIEIVDGFVEVSVDINTTFYDSIDPHLVYSCNDLGQIHEGVSFTVTGNILPNCERFSINLVLDTPHHDVALHINPRLPQNYIVRNCRVKNVWATEEVTSALPFSLHRGASFTIQILVTETEYLISVNGHHFAAFRHRLPYNRVKCLEVKGDVEDVRMERTNVTQYPEMLPETTPKLIHEIVDNDLTTPNDSAETLELTEFSQNRPSLRLPYYGILPDPLLNGKRLRIEGRVKILPHSFYVNLQQGHNIWPHPIIAFHLNPRFANVGGKHVICRNSWFNGQWDREERSEQKTDFTPGKHFTLTIHCTNTTYEVYLNNKFIAEYQFRVDPRTVDTVYLQGDIKLWDIILESSPNESYIT